MADPMQEKVLKLFESCSKAKTDLRKIQKKFDCRKQRSTRPRWETCMFMWRSNDRVVLKARMIVRFGNKNGRPIASETRFGNLVERSDYSKRYDFEKGSRVHRWMFECRCSISTVDDSHFSKKQSSKTSCAKPLRQSRTSSERQRDLLIAKQCREKIEKQNAAALRIAKQQQELELERLQEEQEQLRLRADCLKKKQALRVEELQEENRRKICWSNSHWTRTERWLVRFPT